MSPNSRNHIAKSKGVRREAESERSWRQTSGLTNRNHIQGTEPWVRLQNKPKPDSLKELTSRSNGWGDEKRKQKLKEYIRGWVGYYHLANMKRLCQETDEWLRRRIRMCIWKAWKFPKTRIRNLIKCGVKEYNARQWGYCKGYWRVSGAPIMHMAASTYNLRKAGYPCLLDSYLEWNPKKEPPYAEPHVRWCERSVSVKVGDKCL